MVRMQNNQKQQNQKSLHRFSEVFTDTGAVYFYLVKSAAYNLVKSAAYNLVNQISSSLRLQNFMVNIQYDIYKTEHVILLACVCG